MLYMFSKENPINTYGDHGHSIFTNVEERSIQREGIQGNHNFVISTSSNFRFNNV